MQCFCGSKRTFQQCCEPFIQGEQLAKSPEQLMRSRFSAYCRQQIDYIFQTYHPSQQVNNSKQDIANFAKTCHFIKLEVITCTGQTELPDASALKTLKAQADCSGNLAKSEFQAGFVEFVVTYIQAGKLHQFSEVSRFLPILSPAIIAETNAPTFEMPVDGQNVDATTLQHWQWRYIDGVLSSRPSKSIGRNDSCPCGSGKKFKQCNAHQSAH